MKSLFEEMGGTYRQEGDYLIPNLSLPEESENPSSYFPETIHPDILHTAQSYPSFSLAAKQIWYLSMLYYRKDVFQILSEDGKNR